jgi:hypothetical protein
VLLFIFCYDESAERDILFVVMLGVIMLSAIMLTVVVPVSNILQL